MKTNQLLRTKTLLWTSILLGICLAIAIFAWQLCITYSENKKVDRSFLIDSPCTVPCWQDIIPGTTTSSQALDLLENSVYVRQSSIRTGEQSGSGRATWNYAIPGSYNENNITWEDNIVQDISLVLEYKLTLREIIDKFGMPELLVAGWYPSDQAYLSVDLFYPQLGMSINGLISLERPQIEPAMRIQSLSFFVPSSVEERYTYIHRHQNAEEFKRGLTHLKTVIRSWQGYGDLFEVYYHSVAELELGK